MSNLESKAKTLLQLQLEDEYDSDYKKVCPEMESTLESEWIPFVDAQKEIAEKDKVIQDGIKAHSELYEKLVAEQAKVEAAKRTMQEIPAYKFNALGWEMYDRKEIDEWCNRLYAVLIPRNREQSTETPNAHSLSLGAVSYGCGSLSVRDNSVSPRKENLSEKFIKGCITPLKEPQEQDIPWVPDKKQIKMLKDTTEKPRKEAQEKSAFYYNYNFEICAKHDKPPTCQTCPEEQKKYCEPKLKNISERWKTVKENTTP